MKSSLKSKIEGLNSIDPANTYLPEFMQKAVSRVVSSMHANTYDKHDYKKIIDRCAHLNSEQKQLLLQLLGKYKELFSGKLDKIPGPPVEIKLKRDVKPYQSPVYTIPQAFLQLARTEIADLVEKGVLVKGIESSWKSPFFFFERKDMTIFALYQTYES